MNQLISPKAVIGKGTQLGLNVIIEDDVEIGTNCRIGHGVIIKNGVRIAADVEIQENTILGKWPLTSPRSIFKESKSFTPTEIGQGCKIGANAIVYIQVKIGKHNLIADLATIRENVTIGDLNIIGRGVAIENFVKIGDRCKLETNCYITAYSEIADYCFIAPGVTTSNDNYMGRDEERFKHFKGLTVKRGGRIGVNATILPGKTVREDGMVGGGSLVTKDVGQQEVWAGSPARKKGKVPERQLLKHNLDKIKE